MRHQLAHRGGRSSQATPAAVDKSQSASHTEILTPPLYRASDALYKHRDALQEHLFGQARSMA